MKGDLPRFAGKKHTARSLALAVLLECRAHEAFVQEALDRQLGQAQLSGPDRRLATQLVYAVLRRRGSLDALIRPFLARKPHDVEPWLWEALRLGACQLALLTNIPVHAAINETVELARAFGRERARGFLNAVLRRVSELVTSDWGDAPSAEALPMHDGRYRKLTRSVLPDPEGEPARYLAAGFALPGWLASTWLERLGWDECVRLGFWFAGPAPLWLRVNPLRQDRDACLAAWQQAGFPGEPGTHPQAIRLADHAPVRELPGYAEGWFSVQDEAAMQVASALAPAPGSLVLDLCAAPGGKTAHLAELMQNQGKIIACDVDERRLRTVTELCGRLGHSIVETCQLEQEGEPPAGPFDAILVDVPCSNTGVLGRRPEARWRLRPDDFQRLVPLQTRLLLHAVERLRPGGKLVYSTCSIEPAENRGVVAAVLQAFPQLVIEEESEQKPGLPADGGYWTRLRSPVC
ncbi:MAG: transcription antitermination factor NusB [Gemmataceae bacterium]